MFLHTLQSIHHLQSTHILLLSIPFYYTLRAVFERNSSICFTWLHIWLDLVGWTFYVFSHQKLKPDFSIKTNISWFCLHTVSFHKSGFKCMTFMTAQMLFLVLFCFFPADFAFTLQVFLNLTLNSWYLWLRKCCFCFFQLIMRSHCKFSYMAVQQLFLFLFWFVFSCFQHFYVGSSDLVHRKRGCIS